MKKARVRWNKTKTYEYVTDVADAISKGATLIRYVGGTPTGTKPRFVATTTAIAEVAEAVADASDAVGEAVAVVAKIKRGRKPKK